MKKLRIAALLLALLLMLCGCASQKTAGNNEQKTEQKTETAASVIASAEAETKLTKYTGQFMDVFDTVISVVGCDVSKEAFQEKLNATYKTMLYYHRLFDVYNNYDGINNIKTVNDMAGREPVKVDRPLIDLLKLYESMYEGTKGRVNATIGSVLLLWHETRTAALEDMSSATVPSREALEAAAQHVGYDRIIIDEEASTVYITDPDLRLDVGAVAKGFATERAAMELPEGYLISAGGNVRGRGSNPVSGRPWSVGIADPKGDGSTYLRVASAVDCSVVTSGDYQRYYTVNGKRYCHIVDPDTLEPADRWASVTVITQDSGVADMLSTTLFLLDREEGQKVAEAYGAEAFWIDHDGNQYATEGFEKHLIQ